MQMTGATHSRGSGLSLRHVANVVLLALLVAALIFVLRHLPPQSTHVPAALLVLLASAAALGVLASGLLRGRAAETPVVVVTASGADEVVRMREEHLDFCAGLHAQALAHGFFVSLGPRFMRAYYRTFLESPYAIGLVSMARGHPVGYLVGVLRPQAHARWVLRPGRSGLVLQGAAALAIRPRVAVRFVRSRLRNYLATWRRHRRNGSRSEETGTESDPLPAVLSHMAVVHGARGTGVGFKLVRSFEASARGAGARWATLTTLAGTDGAGPFYERLGWTHRGPRIGPGGLPMEEWARALDEEA